MIASETSNMIIPTYWAEARIKERTKGQQITVRRFGWSDSSQEEAQTNADVRAKDALARIRSGEKLLRREVKQSYNGADGVPIREEVISRHGEAVITRNIYGARCLNTPNVLFADVDIELSINPKWISITFGFLFIGMIFYLILKMYGQKVTFLELGEFICMCVMAFVWAIVLTVIVFGFLVPKLHRWFVSLQGGAEEQARKRIAAFSRKNPDWHLRVYRTPAGFRVMVTHRTFDPNEPAVAQFFRALKVDPVYSRMCLNQQCFRARVSPKPWRAGVADHIKPRPGLWPINPERLPEHKAWIENYEKLAAGYASCHFIEELGTQEVDPSAAEVQKLHDDLSQVYSTLPLA